MHLPPPADPAPSGENIPLQIVYEDEHLLVIDKPAGLVVHPAGEMCIRDSEWPARSCGKGQIVDKAEREPLDPRPGDHGAIIGAKTRRRQDEPQPGLAAKPHQRPAYGAIGGNPARDDHSVGMARGFTEKTQARPAAIDDRIDPVSYTHLDVYKRQVSLRS